MGLGATPRTWQPAGPLYRRIAAAGFTFGDEARCLTEIAADDERAEGRLAEDLSAAHPGLTEAAAQLAYALLPPGAPPVMLAGIGRLTRAPGGPAAHAWLHRTGPHTDGALPATFGLADAAGRALLHAEGAVFAPLPDHGPRWSRLVVWHPAPLPEARPGPAAELWIAPDGLAADALCAALLERLHQPDTARLCIVTRGAQATGHEATPPSPDQAALWGLTLAAMAEQPARACRLIDLDPASPPDVQHAALALEARTEDEPCIAWRAGRRLVRRLEAPAAPPSGPARTATLAAPGLLTWTASPPAPLSRTALRIDVVAAGLTFRDRLLMDGLAAPDCGLGADCAGVVAETGADVTGLAPGDPVVALAAHAIADTLTVEAARVAAAPCADLLAAATMPVPYLTALAGLPPLGPRDRVLIHQAGSATGLAALELARRAGARVIATASRPKHPWFSGLDLDALLDSRAPAHWDTGRLTIAFGAFDAPLAERLRAGGARVVNLDKRAPEHFDLDRLGPATLSRHLHALAGLPPLPRRDIARASLAEALASPATGIGRPVVLLRDPPPVRFGPDATCLVTGAAGALGRCVAAWLAEAGARLCLVDPAPIASAPVPAASGHRVVQADAGDAAAMEALFADLARTDPPLRAVFHCAAITDDDPLARQTGERIAAVLHAKVAGARVLDRLTRLHCQGARRLEHFVLFSSLTGLLPSARQGGYAAANAMLDQLAHARRQRGLPALSLAWGPWQAGIGRAMGPRAAETWRAFGVTPILPAFGLRALPGLLASPSAHRAVADRAWDGGAPAGAGTAGADPAAPAPPAGPVTLADLQALLAPLLGVTDPATLDPDTPLMSFGFNSLTAVEFARTLSRRLARPVAPDFAYAHPTLAAATAALAAPPSPRPAASGFTLLEPVWEPAPPGRPVASGWTVHGSGPVAAALRAALPDDPAALLHFGGTETDRDAYFGVLLSLLQPHVASPLRLVLALPADALLAAASDGLAAALAAEQPGWEVRTIRLDPALPDPAGALARELATAGRDRRLRLTPGGRQRLRLHPAAPPAPWQPDPDAMWLITGGGGGIGARVAAHLIARGARHLALAGRRPDLPPALAASAADIAYYRTDLAGPDAPAALVQALRRAGRPLRGLFHIAGVTADGSLAAGWDRLSAAFPAKACAAARLDRLTRDLELERFVLFSSTACWFGLPGTAGYAAANGALHGIAAARRAAGHAAQAIAWCAWQGVGMAADPALWQSGRAPSLPPDAALAALDAALGSDAASLVVVDPSWRDDLMAAP